MEKKYKIAFIDENGYEYEHLILNESQIKLLGYLSKNHYLPKMFDYIIVNDIEWKEIC